MQGAIPPVGRQLHLDPEPDPLAIGESGNGGDAIDGPARHLEMRKAQVHLFEESLHVDWEVQRGRPGSVTPDSNRAADIVRRIVELICDTQVEWTGGSASAAIDGHHQ